MHGTLVEPDWPPLARDELRMLFAQFENLGEPIEILTVSPRPLSAASVVRTSGGKVFVKRHHRAVRDREGLLEEHRFLAHLLHSGAKVPKVIASASGETAIGIGEWMYEVHAIPAGIDLYEEAISWTPFRTAEHAWSAGKALAELHLAAHGFDAPLRKPRPLVASFTIFSSSNPTQELERYIAARPALAEQAAVHLCAKQALEILAPFHAQLLPLLHSLPPLWTHNDLHCSNLLWSGSENNAQVTAVIDFGLSDRTNAVHDIANAIERNIVEWLQLVADPAHPNDVAVHFDHLEGLLAGYESVRPLSPAEAAALAPMTALCHAEFALSEADYFLGPLHSKDRAAMAYDGWLVGHADWFRSDAGNGLLDAIEHWARNRRAQNKPSSRRGASAE